MMHQPCLAGFRRPGERGHGALIEPRGDERLVRLDTLGDCLPEVNAAVDESLDKLAREDPQAANLVKLRFFAGFSIPDAARLLGISRTSAYEQWAYARAWLRCEVEDRE